MSQYNYLAAILLITEGNIYADYVTILGFSSVCCHFWETMNTSKMKGLWHMNTDEISTVEDSSSR